MKSSIKKMLAKLILIDTTMPEFLSLSIEIAKAIKEDCKKQADKPLKIKVPKVKPPKVKLCDDCSQLLIVKLNEILPEEI
jgi:hypothetical protein